MATGIGGKIELQGASSFQNAMRLAGAAARNLSAEMKNVMSQFASTDRSEQSLTARNEILGRSLDLARQKSGVLSQELNKQRAELDRLEKAVQEATAAEGANSTQVDQARAAYDRQAISVQRIEKDFNDAQAEVNRFTREIDENEQGIRDIQRGYNEAGQRLDEYGRVVDDTSEKTKRFGREGGGAIGDIVSALGLMKIASAAFNQIRQAVSGAVERFDTLNRFPRILEQMGYSAQDASSATQRLSDGVQGLPTKLDDVVATAQRITVLTNNLQGATDITLALNNAFLASGSDASAASRGLEQYVQMLSTGTVDMQSWRSLQETMGLALNKTAEAFGFAGASAQNDLYAALKEGDITFDQFNNKLIELNDGVGGFAELAQTSTGGIATAWENMKTAVVRGVTDMISSINNALADSGLPSIEEMIMSLGKSAYNALSTVADVLGPIVIGFANLWNSIEPLQPLLKAFAVGLGIAAIALTAVAVAQKAVNVAMSLNLIGLIVTAISALVGALIYLWNTSEDFRNAIIGIWEGIKTVVSTVVNAIVVFFTDVIPNAIQAVIDWFASGFTAIGNTVNSVWTSIVSFFTETIPNWIASVIQWFQRLPERIGNAIGQLLGRIVQFGIDAWNWVTTDLPQIILGIIQWFGELPGRIWDWLVQAAVNIVDWGRDIAVSAYEAASNFLTNVITWISQLPKKLWDWLVQTITNIVQWGADMQQRARDAAMGLVNNIINTVKSLPGQMLELGKNIVQGIWNGITGMFNWLKGKISGFASSIVDGFKSALKIGSPSKLLADEIGRWMPPGIAVGFEGALPKAMRDVRGMMGSFTDTFAMTVPDIQNAALNSYNSLPSQNLYDNSSPTIQIIVNANGTDLTDPSRAEELADILADRIDERLEFKTQRKLAAQGV